VLGLAVVVVGRYALEGDEVARLTVWRFCVGLYKIGYACVVILVS